MLSLDESSEKHSGKIIVFGTCNVGPLPKPSCSNKNNILKRMGIKLIFSLGNLATFHRKSSQGKELILLQFGHRRPKFAQRRKKNRLK